MTSLENYPGIKCLTVTPGIDKWVFPGDGPSIIVLGQGRPMKLARVPAHPDKFEELVDKDLAMAIPYFDHSGSGLAQKPAGSDNLADGGDDVALTSEEMGLDITKEISCVDKYALLMIFFFMWSLVAAYYLAGAEFML